MEVVPRSVVAFETYFQICSSLRIYGFAFSQYMCHTVYGKPECGNAEIEITLKEF